MGCDVLSSGNVTYCLRVRSDVKEDRSAVIFSVKLAETCFYLHYSTWGGGNSQWRSWLRHCATSQTVAGSIPDGVIGILPAALWSWSQLNL
jgi:hypothetical protein